jgi:ABC-type dipeptide/oligopeptide/nickel transport system permease subunit
MHERMRETTLYHRSHVIQSIPAEPHARTYLTTAFVAAPMPAPHDPTAVSLEKRLRAPDRHLPLGTDHLGRDEVNQLQYGTGSTLGAASAILVAMMTIAFSVGTLSGYCGRWLDTLLTSVGEVITMYAAA